MNSIFHSGLKYFFVLTFIIHIQSEKLNAQSTNPFTDSSIRARRDIIDVLFKYTKKYTEKRVQDTSKKLFFSLMPVSGGSNEQGVAISAISASFFTDDPQFTNLSNITFYPTTNFKSYFVFKVIPNIWLIRNNWNIAGKFEQARKLEDNYGIGANTSIDSLNPVNFNLSRINVVLSRRMFSNFYLGVGYAMDYFYNIEEEWDKPWPSFFARYPYGTSSESFSSGLILSLIHDNRKNAINSLSGLYANLSIRYNSHWMGSNYDWYSLVFSSKKYISFSSTRHRTLAFWGLYWGNWGEVPYLNLSGTALDFSGWTGRGYYRARYRGQHMLYAEAEYRFDFTKNGLWGAVVFTNAQTFTEEDNIRFQYFKPAGGFGIRLKFNKYSDSNITCDFAFGKQSFNWYVSLNEVF